MAIGVNQRNVLVKDQETENIFRKSSPEFRSSVWNLVYKLMYKSFLLFPIDFGFNNIFVTFGKLKYSWSLFK